MRNRSDCDNDKWNIYVVICDTDTVKPVYKGHSRETENVTFISSCP